MDRGRLIAAIRAQYRLAWDGIHGAGHWERVRENGLRVAERSGARTDVVELFACFHDACRHNNEWDPEHGPRAAELVRRLHGTSFDLDPAGLALLVEACAGHTRGGTTAEATVGTCWDADRLDLGRVGITPEPARLCTAAARDAEILQWAYRRSTGRDRRRPGR
jgi:uncharacterized protein